MRRYTVAIDGRTFTIDVAETASDAFEVSVDGRTFEATLTGDRDLPGVAISPVLAASPLAAGLPEPAVDHQLAAASPPRLQSSPVSAQPSPARPGSGVLSAPMPGVILDVHVAPGAAVRRGDGLLVLEAMKMRNTIRASRDGIVLEICVASGDHVASGDPLVRFGAPPG